MKAACDHPEINDRLMLYITGAIKADEKARVESHIKLCSVCTSELEHLREMDGLLLEIAPELAARALCPEPEALVALAGDAPLAQAQSCRDHLQHCKTCQKEFDLLRDLAAETIPDAAPDAARQRSFMRIVSQETGFTDPTAADTAIQQPTFISGLINNIRDFFGSLTAPLLQPQAVMVRNGKRHFQDNLLVITDRSRGINLRIEIEELKNNQVNILGLFGAGGKQQLAPGLRATLFLEKREMVSRIVEHGKASFTRMPHGSYELECRTNGTTIKRIRFSTTKA
ncbi:MAG: hypothetical protein GY868_19090 [Deltaproteobacteria bacterium]|nr:hypothetical protein [Deltaproteobacteria bacterium]